METDKKESQTEQSNAGRDPAEEARVEECRKTRSPRKDKSALHATGHGLLSKFPLEALVRLGENAKRLRRIERQLRAELKPKGILGAFWFDRFWSSYLRCLMAAKVEGIGIASNDPPTNQPQRMPSMDEGELPILVWQDGGTDGVLFADLLQELTLIARYDRHFSREMYRALGMLLALRSKGEDSLLKCIEGMLGVEMGNQSQGRKNA